MTTPEDPSVLRFEQDPWSKGYIALMAGRLIVDGHTVRIFVDHNGIGLLLPQALKNSTQVRWLDESTFPLYYIGKGYIGKGAGDAD